MTEHQLSVISEQLQTLTRLAALLLVKDRETLFDKVELLHWAGLPPKLIAEVLQTTPNTVSVQISRMRAVARRKKGAGPSSTPNSDPNRSGP
jgi:DNA-directed RNA polymerase specialized sigma24 family protein